MKSAIFSVFYFSLLLICGFRSEAQQIREISGLVTTFKHIPLNKVKVVDLKSGETVFTNSSGQFGIKASEKDVLTITASGFGDRKIKIGKQSFYPVDLSYKDNASNFNSAVTNGHIGENVLREAINSEQLKHAKDYSKYSTIYELIASEVYEVSVKGTSVLNKAIRSFDTNPQVLFVVDDKIVSDISYVSPVYVKSIEFIDDVGATLYGSKGANGVLKITLK